MIPLLAVQQPVLPVPVPMPVVISAYQAMLKAAETLSKSVPAFVNYDLKYSMYAS